MKSTEYSEKVLDHFKNPRNVGTLKGDHVALGRVGNPTCGDIMEVYIKVKPDDDIIEDIKFQTFGCGSAVATSSMTTEMVKGMALEQALKISRKDVADELDGLPPIKMHCSNLAVDALQEAIKNYRNGNLVDVEVEEENNFQTKKIKGEVEFLGKGVSYNIVDLDYFVDQRTLVIYNGDASIEAALKLAEITNRVILVSPGRKISSSNPNLKQQLRASNIKRLTEAEVLEIQGDDEVEKVLLMDLDEEEAFNLVVERIVILNTLTVPAACEMEE